MRGRQPGRLLALCLRHVRSSDCCDPEKDCDLVWAFVRGGKKREDPAVFVVD